MEFTAEHVLRNTSRTMLYTPRTPRTRERQRFSLGIAAAPTDEEHDFEGLEELLRQTWTIFGVSALFGFQQDELYLKRYAKRLREEIANMLTQEDVTYDAKFFIMENMSTRPSPTDPPPVKIEVHTKTIDRRENVEKCIYKGILLSWKTTPNESNIGNSVRLPLLLCRGTRSGMDAVHVVLSRMFDCMVTPLPAKEEDLMWLVPIVIVSSDNGKKAKTTDEIRMEYAIPGLPVTDTITVKFRILDLMNVFKIINEDQNDDTNVDLHFHLEQIEKFHEVLYTQMFETANLRLGLCTLRRINLPALTIMENRMKVMNIEAMNRVLLYLNEKALNMFHVIRF